MRIEHWKAMDLEKIVIKVFGCDRGGMYGYINADHFEHQPFDAALIALAPLWEKTESNEIDKISQFLANWESTLRSDEENKNIDIKLYIDGLEELVETLTKR